MLTYGPSIVQYATTPFKGEEREHTFDNICYLPVHFQESPRFSQWVWFPRGYLDCVYVCWELVIPLFAFLSFVWFILTRFCRSGKDCVLRLLDKDERTRLGSKSGASEVKQHRWFAKINWGLLRNTKPPVRIILFLFLSRNRAHWRSIYSRSSTCFTWWSLYDHRLWMKKEGKADFVGPDHTIFDQGKWRSELSEPEGV